jgi:hypothetical protein
MQLHTSEAGQLVYVKLDIRDIDRRTFTNARHIDSSTISPDK